MNTVITIGRQFGSGGKEIGIRVEDGGWHFGYMGSLGEKSVARRIGTKVVAAAHQEYNDDVLLAEAADRLILGQGMFGREASFRRVEVDESYPEYLRSHSIACRRPEPICETADNQQDANGKYEPPPSCLTHSS